MSNLRLPILRDVDSPPPLRGDAATASTPDLEDEDLMQIGDLASKSGKTVRAIHLYEELDLLRPAARSRGDTVSTAEMRSSASAGFRSSRRWASA